MPAAPALLAESAHGAVRRRRGDLELQFGEVALALGPGDLVRVREMLAPVVAQAEGAGAGRGWALRATTRHQAASFRLYGQDARHLADLIDSALTVLRLDALLLDPTRPRAAA